MSETMEMPEASGPKKEPKILALPVIQHSLSPSLDPLHLPYMYVCLELSICPSPIRLASLCAILLSFLMWERGREREVILLCDIF